MKEKVTEAGGFYIEVPTQKIKPSQTCPNCGHQKKKSLAERVHSCEKCGYSCDRDVAAAQVMINYVRGLERASLDAESSGSTTRAKHEATSDQEASETPIERVADWSSSSLAQDSTMQIERLNALSDNYIFLLYDRAQKIAAVVDPAEPEPVFRRLEALQVDLVAIFNTHHHGDHVGANQALINRYPHLCVYGGKEDRGRIPGQQVFLEEGDRVEFAGRRAEVFFVPGHTRAHIAYYFPPVNPGDYGELFCGDTLFSGGCGRLFEGTPGQMVASLTKLRSLPDQTRVWCAHEYTLNNLKFALTVDPNNAALQQRYREVEKNRAEDIPTIPAILGTEKLTNPFLRWDSPALAMTMDSSEPVQVFARLRGKKDNF